MFCFWAREGALEEAAEVALALPQCLVNPPGLLGVSIPFKLN